MTQVPEWVGYISSGAIFVMLFSFLMKWVVNGLEHRLKTMEVKIDALLAQFHGLDKELAAHAHLPEKVEKLTDRVRDNEKSNEAAWKFIEKKFGNAEVKRTSDV